MFGSSQCVKFYRLPRPIMTGAPLRTTLTGRCAVSSLMPPWSCRVFVPLPVLV